MLRVCTFNMLYERHYAKYASVATMPADERERLLRSTLRDLGAECDVLCFQECHYDSATFADIVASHRYIRANNRDGETCAVAFRADRFDVDDSSISADHFVNAKTGRREPKCALSVTLIDKQNQGRPLRVTSTHVPWDAVSAAPWFSQLSGFTSAARADVVVCGDFNLDEQGGKAVLDDAFPAKDGWLDASRGPAATVCSGRGTFDKIDFVFARRAPGSSSDDGKPLVAAPARTVPAAAHELIKHTRLSASARSSLANPADPVHDLPFGQFPSDHAALISTLQF